MPGDRECCRGLTVQKVEQRRRKRLNQGRTVKVTGDGRESRVHRAKQSTEMKGKKRPGGVKVIWGGQKRGRAIFFSINVAGLTNRQRKKKGEEKNVMRSKRTSHPALFSHSRELKIREDQDSDLCNRQIRSRPGFPRKSTSNGRPSCKKRERHRTTKRGTPPVRGLKLQELSEKFTTCCEKTGVFNANPKWQRRSRSKRGSQSEGLAGRRAGQSAARSNSVQFWGIKKGDRFVAARRNANKKD